MPNKALDPLLKARPNDLRDRKLVRVESDIVDRITVAPAGGPVLTLARKGDGWIQKDSDTEIPIKDGLASKLLADIQSAEAVNFVADLAPDLTPYGLAEPLCTVRLSSYASENTAESKAGEKAITTILFGSVEGDAGYAKLEEEPFIVAVPKSLLESLPRDAYDLLPPAGMEPLINLTPADVQMIEFSSKNGGTPVRLEKKEGAWKAVGESAKANEGAVQNFLSRLAELQGGHRTGSYAPLSKALASPHIQLTLGVQKEGKSSKVEIQVGEALKDGAIPVRVSEKEGVYLIPAADREAFEQKLLE